MTYPVTFYHFGYDWHLRDAKNRTILKINIDGLDFTQQKDLEELCDKIVVLLNSTEGIRNPVTTTVSDAPETSGNGSNPLPEPDDDTIRQLTTKKRGRPARKHK